MAHRDAEATRKNILQAVGRVLSRDGFTGLGVNAIAKEAGIGKPLIYRYFGGLAPLLEEFGKDAHFWLAVADISAEAQHETGGRQIDDYAELVRLSITVIAEQNGRREQGSAGGGGRFNYDYFNDAMLETYAREAVDQALINLDARAAPAGQTPEVSAVISAALLATALWPPVPMLR